MTDGSPSEAHFYSVERYSAQDSIGYLMRMVLARAGQAIDRRLAQHGLTHAQWVPLIRIRTCQTPTLAELARSMDVDPGAMTRMIDRLEAKGLCRRVRSTEDRRVVHLQLTAEGERLADAVRPVLVEVMNRLLAGFSPQEFETLKRLLNRMLANAQALQ
ncbi:MarR family winged helix-turn-helix transcriptional regulator [Caldimonas taiwanensis]|uniref:MarR family winged helix-turn-helix transcriptional regulator n=1 Tax=Caldimonas taiwanensis TaxID=307483 RepID=UPI0007838916|nr:MarR family transcriptional regulator [Caldimonas taiwanensis]